MIIPDKNRKAISKYLFQAIAMRAPADHFFKFIPVSHHNNSRLQSIPKSFRKYLKAGRKNKIAILKRRNQRWAVKIVDDWVFGEGWDKFTKDNGVKDFDIVVFRHEGDMVFDTMVFDSSWCEREYSTDLVTKSSRKSLKKIHRANNVYYSKKSLLKTKKITKPDQSHHPYFVGTLKQYGRNLNKWLYVPKIFALENGLSNGEMILKDVEYEGSWTVNLRSHSGRNFCIQRGLSEFCTAIGLEAGDSFRFELIQKEEKPVAIVSRLPKVALSNPYFRSTVTAYSIKRASLNIPLSFARSNRLDKKNCEMVVMDGKQRLWPTKLCRPGDHVCIRELRDMLVANGLKEGDEILLELIKNEDNPLMKLHDLSDVSPNGKRVQSIFQAIPSRQRVPNPPPNLCFKSTATAHSIEYYHVRVPLRFARANGLFGRNCEMVVIDEKQRLWPTRLCCRDTHVYIRGIRDMWVANGIKKGDEFFLKLVDNAQRPQMTLQICQQGVREDAE